MQFFERNEAALASEKDALEKQANAWGNDAPMIYAQAGTTMLRILPPFDDKGVFFSQITKHRVQVGGKRTEIFACPAEEAGLPCAICVKGQEMTESKDEAQMKFAKENLRPRNQFLYNVLVHSGPADRKGNVPEFGKVYVLETGVMVHRQIISLDQDPATGWADITNPGNGVNLMIKRTGQGLDTKYEVNPHGAGRTDVFADCAARGIDPNSLELFNLNEVYAIPDEEKVEEVASKAGAGMFGATPAPRPALQTASPAAAAATPAAPAPTVPVPVAAPAAQPLAPAQAQAAHVGQPIPPAQAGPVVLAQAQAVPVAAGIVTSPVAAVAPAYMQAGDDSLVAPVVAAPAQTAVPQPPAVPAPPKA
jgi:hypothetical protein